MFRIDGEETGRLTHAVKCPYCEAHLEVEGDEDNPSADDSVSCYFHGVVGTRRGVTRAARKGELEMKEMLDEAE